MKHKMNFISRVFNGGSTVVDTPVSKRSQVSNKCRLTVGRLSTLILLFFTLGIGQMWAGNIATDFFSTNACSIKYWSGGTNDVEYWFNKSASTATIGDATSFRLKGWSFCMWKNNSGNICDAGTIYYRVYPVSQTSSLPGFSSRNKTGVNWNYQGNDKNANFYEDTDIDLGSSLSYFNEYYFECYFKASGKNYDDWGGCGDMYLSNDNNSNYKIKFNYIADKIYVAGNGSNERGNWCGGKYWSADGSLMTRDGSTYSITFNNLPARNDDYEFKLTTGAWKDDGGTEFSTVGSCTGNIATGGSVSGTNVKFKLTNPANVTITFDGSNICVTKVDLTLSGDYYLRGDMWLTNGNGWTDVKSGTLSTIPALTKSADETSASVEMVLSKGPQRFTPAQFKNNTKTEFAKWSGTVTRSGIDNYSYSKSSSGDKANFSLSSAKKVVITYRSDETLDITATDYTVKKTGWKLLLSTADNNDNFTSYNMDDNGTVTIPNLGNGTYRFRISDGTSGQRHAINWFGGLYVDKDNHEGITFSLKDYYNKSKVGGVTGESWPIADAQDPTGRFKIESKSNPIKVKFTFDGGKITINEYVPTPYTGDLWITGDCTDAGWQEHPDNAYKFTNDGQGHYTWTGQLNVKTDWNSGFKFLHDGWCSGSFGPKDNLQKSCNGDCRYRNHIDPNNEGTYNLQRRIECQGNDQTFLVTANSGVYTLTLDLTDQDNGKMSITKAVISGRTYDGTEYMYVDALSVPGWCDDNVAQYAYFKDVHGTDHQVTGSVEFSKVYKFLVPQGEYQSVKLQRGTNNATGYIPLSGTTKNYIKTFAENSTSVTWDTYSLGDKTLYLDCKNFTGWMEHGKRLYVYDGTFCSEFTKVPDCKNDDLMVATNVHTASTYDFRFYNWSDHTTHHKELSLTGTNNACKITNWDEGNAETVTPNYTVHFNKKGHGSDIADRCIAAGSSTTDPQATASDGYTCEGWYTNDGLTDKFIFGTTTITGATTLYAKWVQVEQVTVTFATNGGTPTPDPQTIDKGGKATKPATDPKKNGYYFTGWDWNFNNTISENKTINATWHQFTMAAQLAGTTATITPSLPSTHGALYLCYELYEGTQVSDMTEGNKKTIDDLNINATTGVTTFTVPDGSKNYMVRCIIHEGEDCTDATKLATLNAALSQSIKSTVITLNANGGSSNGTAKATKDKNTLDYITHVGAYNGYSLTGYYTANTGGNKVINADGTLVANVDDYTDASGKWTKTDATCTLHAQWNKETYTITYENLNGAETTNKTTYDVTTATFTLSDPTPTINNGKVFKEWQLNNTAITEIPLGSYGNKTINAVWVNEKWYFRNNHTSPQYDCSNEMVKDGDYYKFVIANVTNQEYKFKINLWDGKGEWKYTTLDKNTKDVIDQTKCVYIQVRGDNDSENIYFCTPNMNCNVTVYADVVNKKVWAVATPSPAGTKEALTGDWYVMRNVTTTGCESWHSDCEENKMTIVDGIATKTYYNFSGMFSWKVKGNNVEHGFSYFSQTKSNVSCKGGGQPISNVDMQESLSNKDVTIRYDGTNIYMLAAPACSFAIQAAYAQANEEITVTPQVPTYHGILTYCYEVWQDDAKLATQPEISVSETNGVATIDATDLADGTYTIKCIVHDGDCNATEITTTQTNVTIARTYTVTVSGTAHVNASPASVTAGASTASADITATVDYGYAWAGWILSTGVTPAAGCNNMSNPIKVNATQAGTVTANTVSLITYAVTAATATNGTIQVTTSPASMLTGTQVTATPNKGYYFAGWKDNSNGTFDNKNNATTVFKPTAVAEVDANFTKYNSTLALSSPIVENKTVTVTPAFDSHYPDFTICYRVYNSSDEDMAIDFDINNDGSATFTAPVNGTYTLKTLIHSGKNCEDATIIDEITQEFSVGMNTHNVIVPQTTEHYTMSTITSPVQVGTKVNFTVTPDAGYYTTVTSPDATLTPDGNNYSFTMPDNDVTINVACSERWGLVGSLNEKDDPQGGMPGWTDANAAMFTVGDAITLNLTLEPNKNYKFQIYDKRDTKRHGQKNDATMTPDATPWKLDGNKDVYIATAGYGTYTFTIAESSDGNDPEVSYHAPASYQIHMGKQGEGTLTGVTTESETNFNVKDKDYVRQGGSVNFTATPADSYYIEGWYSNSDCTAKIEAAGTNTTYTVSNIAAETSVYVKFMETLTDVTVFDGINTTTVQVGVTTHPQITFNGNDGRKFTQWTVVGASVENASFATTRITGVSGDGEHTVTGTYQQLPVIYFKETISEWNPSEMYVYFYQAEYENYLESGAGSMSDGGGKWAPSCMTETPVTMQKMDKSDIWYAYYDKSTFTVTDKDIKGVVFLDKKEVNQARFYSCTGAYRMDFNSCMNMYVATGGYELKNGNTACYRNEGFWKNYNKETSGLFIHIFDGGGTEVKSFELNNKVSVTEFNKTEYLNLTPGDNYYFYINTCSGANYSEHGTTVTSANCNNIKLYYHKEKVEDNKTTFVPSAHGDYTFTVIHNDDNTLTLSVDYPLSVGDYHVVSVINGDVHDNGYIYKASTTAQEKASFYVKNGATVKLQKCTNISGSTITWTDVAGQSISISGLAGAECRTYTITHNGADATLADAGTYTGNFYIRVDGVDGGWTAYMTNPDNKMHHTLINPEYEKSIDHSEGYDYYQTKWIEKAVHPNVKCVVANDYSKCISDTLKGDEIIGLEEQELPMNANVRFMWNSNTNAISRAYMSGSTNASDRFLVLIGDNSEKDGKYIYNTNGDRFNVTGLEKDETIFTDNGNWVYQVDIKADVKARVQLTAKFNGKTQYFKGNDTGAGWTDRSEQIIGGTGGGIYNIRVVYDFKTNTMVGGWLPDHMPKTTDEPLSADIIIVRHGQDQANQISFSGSGAISDVKRVYGALEFRKEEMVDKMNTWTSVTYQNCMYYISFPFDVRVSDIFGIGDYNDTWVLQEYNGAKRAQIGWFAETKTFWEDIPYEGTLKANVGYSLIIDRPTFNDGNSSVWRNTKDNSRVYIYFPSAEQVGGLVQADDFKVTIPDHECKIDREFTINKGMGTERVVNHKYTDSHWNMMGVPVFQTVNGEEYTDYFLAEEPTFAESTFKYLYAWNSTNNTLFIQNVNDGSFKFKAMHGYMVQYYGDITWSGSIVEKGKPDVALAPRRETPTENFNIELQLHYGGSKVNHTYVELRDGANTDFALNEDVYMMTNTNAGNIYSLAGSYDVAANVLPIESQLVSLGVIANKAGDFTFTMPSNFTGTVTLIDAATNEETILNVADYTIKLAKGTYEGRFFLKLDVERKIGTDINGADYQGRKDVFKYIDNDHMYIMRDGKIYDGVGASVK